MQEIMSKNSLNLVKNIRSQIQECQQTPNSINNNKTYSTKFKTKHKDALYRLTCSVHSKLTVGLGVASPAGQTSGFLRHWSSLNNPNLERWLDPEVSPSPVGE